MNFDAKTSISSRRLPKTGDRAFVLLILLGTSAVIAIGAIVAIYFLSGSTGGANPDDPEQVAMGQTVYQQSCASCHGADLEGQPEWRVRKSDGKFPAPPHDENGHTWHHPDKQLFKIIKTGFAKLAPGYESDMPIFENVLTDAEIWASLAYIKSTWPTEIRQRQDRRSQGTEQ